MKKKKIAVFANGWSDQFVKSILEGLRSAAKEDSVDIFVFLTYVYFGDVHSQSKHQLNIYHLPRPEDFDGAIMLTNTFNNQGEEERVRALFQKSGIPMISTEVKVPDMPFVGTDNYSGTYSLTKHLVDVHNAQKIVFIKGIAGNVESAQRQQAVEDALEEYGLKLTDAIQGDFSFNGAYDLVGKWLEEHELPDAFVCANDHMALGTCCVLDHKGYNVPDDIKVTGFDNVWEAKESFPIIATVSRRWDKMGGNLYHELKKHIENPDNTKEIIYPSEFVPSESCGCPACKEDSDKRMSFIKNGYFNRNVSNMMDITYQNLRVWLAKCGSIEEFNEIASDQFNREALLGPDFYICVEPQFFELDDELYPKRIRGYSKEMEVAFGMEDGKPIKPFFFDTDVVVPKYKNEEGKSNLYIVTPLSSADYIIGYLVMKNYTESVYNLMINSSAQNINGIFITMRQYKFAQETNRKLKEIYMTDFLTGIYNRTGCENVLYSFIDESRKKGKTSVLYFFDVNRMKTINDVYGHLNGDTAIKATADGIKKFLGNGWLLGRYGGDEFIAVGPCENKELLEAKRDELSKNINEYFDTLNLSFKLSISVGYSVIESDDEGTIDSFIKIADDSMYEEKKKAHEYLDSLANQRKV